MFKSFQVRLVLFFVALFAVVVAVAFTAVRNGIVNNIFAQAQDQLLTAGGILDRRITMTHDDLAQGTALLASDFGFRQAVATADHRTVLSALDNLASRIKADRIMLLSLDGLIVADTGSAVDAGARGNIVTIGEANAPFPFAEMTEAAELNGRAVSIAVMDGRIYQLVVVPILAPVPIAWITIGLEIGDVFAGEMRKQSIVPVEISFGFPNERNEWRIESSTMTPSMRPSLAEALKAHGPITKPVTLAVAGSDYVTLMAPVPGPQQANTVYAILQYSLDLALAPYRSLFVQLLLLAATAVLMSLIGAAFVASSVTRPIRRLDAAAQRIQIGRYTEKVPVTQDDEIGRLSLTFNQMMEGIAEREEKIAYQARHDMVTGLPNRLAFEAQLASVIAALPESNDMRLSVVLIQVGRFAEINNTLGHDTGDQLLHKISHATKFVIPPDTFMARHASNMIALALTDMDDDTETATLERLVNAVSEPVEIGGANIDVNVTVGVARYPIHGTVPRTLLQHADSAIYVAKKKGQTIAVYDASLDQHRPERLSMMGELRQGLEKGQFKFYFQPKVDIASGRITAAEALIRWIHPERGFMPPDQFIPLAEQTGNIARVTAWALDAAIKQSKEWSAKGIDIKIAVNLSARDLMDRHLPDTLTHLLAKYGVSQDRMILEITESAIMEDPMHAVGLMKQLSDMGFTLSIDDYGTGYSSLAYLKSLPVKEIKIDKSFVLKLASSTNDEILVRSTIELGHNLGLKVTAEGVEDAAALEILKDYGCETGQGYFISKPLPADAFETFYATSRWSPRRNAANSSDLPDAAPAGE